MASKPVTPITPKYYDRWVPPTDYFQPDVTKLQGLDVNIETKINELKICGVYTSDMNEMEIDHYYSQLIVVSQSKQQNEKKTIISPIPTTPKVVEKKLVVDPVLKPISAPIQITTAPKITEDKKSVQIDSSISITDMKEILQLYNVNTTAKTDDEVKELYQIYCMTEQRIEAKNEIIEKPVVNSQAVSSQVVSSQIVSSHPVSSQNTPSQNTTGNECRNMIRDKLEQLITDDLFRNTLLISAGNKSNISIDAVADFIIELNKKNGGVSDIQNDFLLKSGYFGNETPKISSPFGKIVVIENQKKYHITNFVENKGDGGCGIHWIPAALRAGLIKLGEVERNMFGIDENSDSDNWGFRIKISNMVDIRKGMISRANKTFSAGEGILSALSENLFTREFLNEGYYIKSEEVYIIAFMLNIKVKILMWENDHAIVYYNQTTGTNEEPVYLYLWNNHYYIMRKTE